MKGVNLSQGVCDQPAPDAVKEAPLTMPVRRLNDVLAARNLDVAWKPAD